MPNTYAITIAGSTKQIQTGWSISESVNGRATFTCDVLSKNSTYRPPIGAEVIFTENATRIFGGYINRPSEEGFSKGITTHIEAVDYNVLADRRIIQDTTFAAGNTLKQNLTQLVAFFSGYGVTLDASQVNGPSMAELYYDVRSGTSILDEWSVITGFVWNIDYNKKLRMTDVGELTAPFNITGSAGRYTNVNSGGDVTVVSEREGYANRIIVKAGTGTAEVTDTFIGDGVATVFPLTYSFINGWVVVVNGLFETLGTGATWEYDSVTNSITRNSPAPAVPISITYIAQFPYVATADAGALPADLIERVYTATDVFDADVAQSIADGYLARALDVSKTVQYQTRRLGLFAGQTQTITIAERNLSGSFLLTDVQTDNPVGDIVTRTVTATGGSEYHGSWRDKLRQLGGGSGGGGGAVGGVTVITGATFLPSPAFLGGSRNTGINKNPVAWTPVVNYVPFVAMGSFSGRLRADIWVRNAGIGVAARLYDVTAGAAVATSGTVTLDVPTEVTVTGAITSGHKYQMEILSSTNGEAVYGIGSLESL